MTKSERSQRQKGARKKIIGKSMTGLEKNMMRKRKAERKKRRKGHGRK